jgi:uncharacterized peroxidase-related enzyme
MKSSASFLADPPMSREVQVVYDDDRASDGYINNLTRAWSWRPDVLTAFQDVRNDLVAASSLTPREVAVMVAATAAARGDSYCAFAWGIKLAGLSDEVTAAGVLDGDTAGLSSREAALTDWSRQVVRDPNGTTEADVEHLREAGFDDREIFEATAWIGFRLAFSTINDALGAPPDRELIDEAPEIIKTAITFGRRPAREHAPDQTGPNRQEALQRTPPGDRSAPPAG